MVKNELVVCTKFDDPVILHGGMWLKVVLLKSVCMLESPGKLQNQSRPNRQINEIGISRAGVRMYSPI